MNDQQEWTIKGRDVLIERWDGNLLETITKEEAELRLNEYETLKKATERLSAVQITCLCGSSRFTDIMAVVGWLLERDENKIITGLHLLPQWYPNVPEHHLAEAEGVAEQLDKLHLRKIDIADEIFVIDWQGYIGESTSREIEYAIAHNKPVRYLTREDVYSSFVHDALVAYANILDGKSDQEEKTD